LHLAAMALDLGPDSTVIVPAITFVATANAARYVGARAIFADVDPATGLMTPETLEAALKRAGRADAVFPVHLAGQSCDMAAIHRIAERERLFVVEDACHALGTRYNGPLRGGYPVGACSHSDMTVFSFHPVKTIAMGEGGAITAHSGEMARRLRMLRSHGIERESGHFVHEALAYDRAGVTNPWYYELQALGFNYRASDIHCALGLSQLGKLARFAAARAALVCAYDEALAPLAPMVKPPARVQGCTPAWHLYAARVDFAGRGLERAAVMRALAKDGIGTQVHYLPVPFQPYYAQGEAADPATLYPGAAAYYEATLSLPLFVGMVPEDPARIAKSLSTILGL
jgi:dTDP-4-amino-4,6-dideoxygalactose transaminase